MTKMTTSDRSQLKPVNPSAAAIDIGSTMHMAAVNPDSTDTPIRAFRTFTHDLHDLAVWFKSCGVTSVAMESTGVYWIPAFEILEQHGLEVILVNARYAKNVPGRKTDDSDAGWLRQLHSLRRIGPGIHLLAFGMTQGDQIQTPHLQLQKKWPGEVNHLGSGWPAHLGNQAGFDARKSGALAGQQQPVGRINPSSDLGQAICQSCDQVPTIAVENWRCGPVLEKFGKMIGTARSDPVQIVLHVELQPCIRMRSFKHIRQVFGKSPVTANDRERKGFRVRPGFWCRQAD